MMRPLSRETGRLPHQSTPPSLFEVTPGEASGGGRGDRLDQNCKRDNQASHVYCKGCGIMIEAVSRNATCCPRESPAARQVFSTGTLPPIRPPRSSRAFTGSAWRDDSKRQSCRTLAIFKLICKSAISSCATRLGLLGRTACTGVGIARGLFQWDTASRPMSVKQS